MDEELLIESGLEGMLVKFKNDAELLLEVAVGMYDDGDTACSGLNVPGELNGIDDIRGVDEAGMGVEGPADSTVKLRRTLPRTETLELLGRRSNRRVLDPAE